MRYEVGAMEIWANDPNDAVVAQAREKDMVYFRVRYEF
jgi:hypothetical protein